MTTNKANKVSKTTTAKTAAKPAVKPAVKTTAAPAKEEPKKEAVKPVAEEEKPVAKTTAAKKITSIKRAKLYVKPEEGKAYYVVNEGLKNGSTGAVDL